MFNVASMPMRQFARGLGDLPSECAADPQGCEQAITTTQKNLDNLGQRMSTLVHFWNDKKRELMVLPDHPTQEQMAAYLEQRKQATQSLLDQFQSEATQYNQKVSDLRTRMSNLPIAMVAMPPVTLMGRLGAIYIIDTQPLVLSTTAEEGKMVAIQGYWPRYVLAVQGGVPPPPLPPAATETTQEGLGGNLLWIGALALGAILLLGGGGK